MQMYLRRSKWTKAAALGFISMILIGNIWLVFFLTGQAANPWLLNAINICMVWTTLSACGMGFTILSHRSTEVRDDDSVV